MTPFPPHRTSLRAAALGVAGLALGAGVASAQQALELRGPVLESSVTDGLLASPAAPRVSFDDDLVSAVPEPVQRSRQQTQQRPATASATARSQDQLTTGTVRAPRLDTLDEERNARADRDNQRAGAIEGLDRRSEENAFAPLGIRAGTFLLMPRLDQGIGWTSNASAAPGGGESFFSETALRLEAISDWSRHSAVLRADGAYRRSLSGERISEIEGGVDGELRLDLGHDFSAHGGLGYRVRPESASSPSAIADVVSRPLRHTFNGQAGLARDAGRFQASLTGNVARNIYENAELSDGTIVSQGDRDSTLATATLRLGYEVSPALRPFIEGEVGRRFYDEKLDGDGYARSADRYSLRAGVEVDLREKLSGEFSAGWLTERPDDDRLAAISGFVAAGGLAWSPVRGTTVELSASTEVESATTAGETGSLLYSGSLAVSRELRADLTGRALVGMDWRDYAGSDGRDFVLRGEASLTWWMNRNVGITGRARHELQRSNLPDRDYDATSVYLGMTLQR